MRSKASETRPGSPLLAFTLSLLTPGLGQLYNGQGKKAAAVFLGSMLLSVILLACGGVWVKWGIRGLLGVMALKVAYLVLAGLAAARSARCGASSSSTTAPLCGAVLLGSWLVLPMVLKLILAPTVNIWPVRSFAIPSRSMEPTVRVGDRIFLDATAYRDTPPQRMDIIIHRVEESEAILIKRVVGVPGDSIEIKNGKLEVNDQVIPFPASEPASRDFGPVSVGDGHVFTLGDNWNDSRDSRFTGPVRYDYIEGKVRFIFLGPGAGTDFP